VRRIKVDHESFGMEVGRPDFGPNTIALPIRKTIFLMNKSFSCYSQTFAIMKDKKCYLV